MAVAVAATCAGLAVGAAEEGEVVVEVVGGGAVPRRPACRLWVVLEEEGA